ncbi:hypothetical protein MBLNU230_g7026t1 [Neophaeotheca triangularis]
MSSSGFRLGGHAFNHGPSQDAEQEYDRLRDAARNEQSQYHHFAGKSQQAYQSGDGAGAKDLSEQGKRHAAKADDLNRQASEFIFRENNAYGKVDSDTIDLHGQYVEEAEEILEQRIRHARNMNQGHLNVIVGKGNHSQGHVQKLKPRVEQVCRELGLQYHTDEENEGRIYVDLKPGGGGGPGPGAGYGYGGQTQHPQYGQPMYETAYPMRVPGGSSGGHANAGYPGARPQQDMHYGGQQQQSQQMQYQEPQNQKKESKCCGLCIVM